MDLKTDSELLELHRQGSQEAFAELVQRHINWIYSIAKRRVPDEHLAEDITQATFAVLARKSPILGPKHPLSAWLFHVVTLASKAALRTESRRRHHETEAAKMRNAKEASEQGQCAQVTPDLDDWVGRLNRTDRGAILLRFYEQKSFAEVSTALGVSEIAARRRVSRATARLRAIAARQGVVVPTAALAEGLLSQVTLPAPSALAASISTLSSAIAVAKPVSMLTTGVIIAMKWTQIKIAAALTLALLIVGGTATLTLNRRNPQAASPGGTIRLDPALAPATQPGDAKRGMELYEAARRKEDWIHNVTSFYVRFEGRWDQSQYAIAKNEAELESRARRVPSVQPDSNAWPIKTDSLVLAFDATRVIRRLETYGVRLSHSMWNTPAGVSYNKEAKEARGSRSIKTTLDGELQDLFLPISWLRATPRRSESHAFWWDAYRTSPRTTQQTPVTAELVGRVQYHGRDCYIVDLEHGWTRLLISATGQPFVHGVVTYVANRTADRDRVRRAVATQLGVTIADDDQLLRMQRESASTDAQRVTAVYRRELLKQSHVQGAHYLLDYREVSPGRWFPMVQGYVLFDEPDAQGNPMVTSWRGLCAVDARVDQPLPEQILSAPVD